MKKPTPNRTSGFTMVTENNPIFDTTKLNKAFSNNLVNINHNESIIDSSNKDANKQKNGKYS